MNAGQRHTVFSHYFFARPEVRLKHRHDAEERLAHYVAAGKHEKAQLTREIIAIFNKVDSRDV